jgi:hypothetical protein
MNDWGWPKLLQEINETVHRYRSVWKNRVPPDRLNAEWLGFPAATDAEIDALEKRFGTKLPPSYVSFLKFSNGWGPIDEFLWRFLPADEVGWFRDINRAWLDAWLEPWLKQPDHIPDDKYFVYGPSQDQCAIRNEYLEHTLQISEEGDGAVVLLNPLIQSENNEWEAWYFAHWLPGAYRFRNFFDLVQTRFAAMKAREDAKP